ncbi:MAG: hypothetical protein IBJ10_01140 [Phycisphaerales bacterium]|nr:hypothetical protein [Phycisphaerales bacterium]
MLTPEQLRAIVMATLSAPHAGQDSRWMSQWEHGRLQRYIDALRRDADLIIAAADMPAVRNEPDADEEPAAPRPCQHQTFTLEVDGVWRCVRCGATRSLMEPGPTSDAPAFETDAHGDRGVVVVPPARAIALMRRENREGR